MCLVSFSKTPQYSALKKLNNKSLLAWAYIVICDDCSHKCSWCYGGFNEDLSSYMSLQDFQVVLNKLKEMDVFQISLAGGEPTEHPHFREIVALASRENFLLHLVTHGEHLDSDTVDYLKDHNIEQVQINWQGRRHHDQVHGVAGSYENAVQGIKRLMAAGIEVTATTTVGKYNLKHIEEIFKEAAELGVTRLRVWESTGRGNAWRKNLDTKEIFETCRSIAKSLGYGHCLSYDPVFKGEVNVPCLQFSNLFMYISSKGKLNFCGAVPEVYEMSDFLNPEINGKQIRAAYLSHNKSLLNGERPYCVAREGFHNDYSVLKFI